LEEFRQEGGEISQSLIVELQSIHNRETLLAAAPRLKPLFLELTNLIIAAHEFRDTQLEMTFPDPTAEEYLRNTQLREELLRICEMDGGKEVLDKAQEEALNRLDAYLHAKNQQRELRRY
jgi:hypothetical protein